MSALDEKTEEALMKLNEETEKVNEKVQAYSRKLMRPTWDKRREIVKNIPDFWPTAVGNCPLFSNNTNEDDLAAVKNLTDLNVEYDEKNPHYRKVTATFKKNDVFKNEKMVKEFVIGPDEDEILSKTTIEYHSGKEPTKKRKHAEEVEGEEDELPQMSFHEWFADEENRPGFFISEDIFPNAIDFFNDDVSDGGEYDDEDEDEGEYDIGESDSEVEEEKDTAKQHKKAKK
ncbi:hypothetical protein J3Q64DRAFT_1724639 [Phycomyces blakesleeanus]|uniref:Uncharacterized protein n=2 Tax=Phycomyces blakesleeanus TaxID=4837 RepID=A0A167R083_PHYB8|nr:hypothetical protein PHYBLDRAFT_161187 [Phycomyces blakesleeanus NRRL 1555(-)]OAD80544.1 hypothetical protein PHYBLDRAFT_161187 [Phycomyces blakesleeanus NRRL 1555(-)]|eukprot:XP_018298584.1 hypothetical protein PHYBLDRAFT_161187 [Phycomyces blakesleeanus NRRL 1555(-)]